MADNGSESGNLTVSFIGSSDSVYDIECDACLDDDKHLEAAGFCVTCHEYLCDACVKEHGTNRLSRNHDVQSKSQMPRQKPPQPPSSQAHPATSSIVETCDLHQTRIIEYFCSDDALLTCSIGLVDHRQCREVDHVSKFSEHMLDSQAYKQFTDSLISLRNKSKDVIKNAKDNTLKAVQICTDVTSDLQDLRKDAIQAFDKLDNDIKKKSDTIKLANLKKIKDIGDKGKDDLSEVDKISTEIETLQSKNQLDQLFVRMIKLKDRVQTLHSGLDEADRNNTVTTYKFKPGAAAQDFIDKPESFGTLSKEDSATGVNQTPEPSEMTRQQLLDKIVVLNKEKADITEQLSTISRQGQTLSEELVSTKNDVDRINTQLQCVNNENETFVQEKAELIGRLTATERENHRQVEALAVLRKDKDVLEVGQKDLLARNKKLQREISRLCKEKAADLDKFEHSRKELQERQTQQERDMQMALLQEKQAHEIDIKTLSQEKDRQCSELENKQKFILNKHELEMKDTLQAFDKMQTKYEERLSALQRDSDNALLKAEQKHQQVVSKGEQKKSTLQQKNTNLSKELAAANVKYEKLRSESQTSQEQDKTSISDLQFELKNLRSQLEQTCEANKKEAKKLTSQLRDVEHQHEAAARQCDDLTVRLKEAEETRYTINKELTVIKSGLELPTDIKTTLYDVEVKENEIIKLQCKLSKPDKPVTWLKDDKEITADGHLNITMTADTHEIVITRANVDDAGKYSCVCGDVKTECTVTVKVRSIAVKATKVGTISVRTADEHTICTISGSALLPGDKLVLADRANNKIKLVNLQTSEVTSVLNVSDAWDVAVITDDQVVVTLPVARKIVFVTVTSDLKLDREMGVEGECTGIVYNNDTLIVTFSNPVKIQIMTLDGNVGKNIKFSGLFKHLSHIALNPTHDAIYVSYYHGHSVKRLGLDGEVEAEYKDEQLNIPTGIIVDQQGRVIVCGGGYQGYILLLTADLTMSKVLEDGISHPESLSLCHSTGRLYVGRWNDKISVYQLSQ